MARLKQVNGRPISERRVAGPQPLALDVQIVEQGGEASANVEKQV